MRTRFAFPCVLLCLAALFLSCGDAYYDLFHENRANLVLGPPPEVESIAPTMGLDPNLVPDVVVTGSNFATGAMVRLVRSGCPDINASNVTVVSDTEIHCEIILPWAMYGMWSVAVTNPDGQTGYLADAFDVTWPDPAVASMTPNSGSEPNTVFVTDLAGTHFMPGASVQLRRGASTIDATGEFTVDPFHITCFIPLSGASYGPWDVVVTNPVGGPGVLSNAFTVGWDAPSLSGISPASLNDPGTYTVTITGNNFKSGASVRFTRPSYADIVASVTGVSLTAITCSVPLSGAMYGPWTAEVQNSDGNSTSLAGCLTVNWQYPTVSSITPNSGNEPYTVHITSLAGTHFMPGADVRLTRSGYPDILGAVSSVTPTSIDCYFDLAGAARGTWNVFVNNGSGSPGYYTLSNAFTVGWDSPTLTSITPATGLEGTVPVTISNLAGTGLRSGVTVRLVRSGYPDITATGVTVSGGTQIACSFNLSGAMYGSWDVVVTNPDTQSASLGGAFTVTWPAPTVTSVAPASGARDSVVTITNLAGTNFKNGAGVRLVRSGYPDIIATGVSVTATQITCQFDLAGAASGSWDVVVSNADGGLATLAGAFTVTVGLTYDGNGNTSGTAPVDPNAYSYGENATVLGNTGGLYRSGYMFDGWNTEADGTGTLYAQDDIITMGVGDMTLYADWKPLPFVAVGDGGTILRSADNGVSWSNVSPGGGDLNDVTFGNGIFIAVGDGGRVLRSDDNGLTWIDVSPGGDNLNGVAYGNGIFVAVGSGFPVWRSTDNGLTWTSNPSYSWSLNDITYGNGYIVGGGTSGRRARSTDGITWINDIAGGGSDIIRGVAYGNALFIAVGGTAGNRIFRSDDDGVSWTNVSPGGDDLYGVAHGNGIFVAVGSYGRRIQSIDGITWTNSMSGGSNLRGIAYGNGYFVAVGLSGRRIRSANGITWTNDMSGGSTLNGVAYGSE